MSTKQIKVFLDSSVIISGLASKKGGSHKLLALAEAEVVTVVISDHVINEVLRNIQKKLPDALPLFEKLFETLPFQLVQVTQKEITSACKHINTHDAPVLAAAISGRVDWLVSLDKHFLRLKGEEFGFKVGTPGDFLEQLSELLKTE